MKTKEFIEKIIVYYLTLYPNIHSVLSLGSRELARILVLVGLFKNEFRKCNEYGLIPISHEFIHFNPDTGVEMVRSSEFIKFIEETYEHNLSILNKIESNILRALSQLSNEDTLSYSINYVPTYDYKYNAKYLYNFRILNETNFNLFTSKEIIEFINTEISRSDKERVWHIYSKLDVNFLEFRIKNLELGNLSEEVLIQYKDYIEEIENYSIN